MDLMLLMKAGFAGFALAVGVIMLTFYVAGWILRIGRTNYKRVMILGCLASFLVIDSFLYYKTRIGGIQDGQLFLAGCVGGWLGGLTFVSTQLKRFLLDCLK
jgi:hypothetical protein